MTQKQQNFGSWKPEGYSVIEKTRENLNPSWLSGSQEVSLLLPQNHGKTQKLEAPSTSDDDNRIGQKSV